MKRVGRRPEKQRETGKLRSIFSCLLFGARCPACGLLMMGLIMLGWNCGDGEERNRDSRQIRTPEEWTIWRGDRLFTGHADGELPETLDLIWRYEAGDAIFTTPVVADGKVFFGSMDGVFHAVDLQSGLKVWADSTGSSIEAPALCMNEKIIVGTTDGDVVAYGMSGVRLWEYHADGKVIGSANWIEVDGSRRIFVGSYDSKMHCIDAETGRRHWTFDTKNFINGGPALQDSLLIFGGCDALLHLLCVRTGKQRAAVDVRSYMAGSPMVHENKAYVGTYGAQFYGIDLDAHEILWMFEDEDEGDTFFSSPAISDNRVVIGSRDHRVHCMHAETGEQLWTFRTQDEVDSSPVIIGHHVLFGSADGRMYMIRLETGELIWSYDTGGAIFGSPAVAGGRVLIGAEDGGLYAFGVKESLEFNNQ